MATVTISKIQVRRSKTAAYRPPSSGGTALGDGEFFFSIVDGQWRIGGIATDIPALVASNAEAIAGTAQKIVTPPGLKAAIAAEIAALVVVVDGGQEG